MDLQPFRVCSDLIVRSVDDESRSFEGTATTTATDSNGDVIESKGAVYKLPIPLLIEHNRREPVGEVTAVKIVSGSEITVRGTFAKADAGLDYVERAWRQLKAGLIKGLSIGAQPLKAEPILNKDGRMTGIRYTAWRWRELSAVVLPMNEACTIDVIRAFDPWGAMLYRARPAIEPGPEPADQSYEATRARVVAALQANARALHRV